MAFCILSVTCGMLATENAKEKYTVVSNDFSLPLNNYMLLMKNADVDNDGKEDEIYVYGEKKNEMAVYAEKINVAVKYKKNGFVKKTSIAYLKGFVADVVVADLTKNKYKDILLTVFADQNKSVLSGVVVDFGQSIPRVIFNKFSGISPQISFSDGFLADVKLVNGQQFAVNLNAKRDQLIASGFFDDSGKALGKTKIYAKPFFELKEENGKLKGSQLVVAGQYETEIFKLESSQQYTGTKWNITKIEIKY